MLQLSALRRARAVGVISFALLLAAPVAATALANARSAHVHNPTVQLMIVGKNGRILQAARQVTAAQATVSAGGNRCRVAAGTPLAALAALARLHSSHTTFALSAFAPCDLNPATGESLFVTKIDGVALSAAEKGTYNGWVFKVGNRGGTAGAGNEKGPFGNGRKLADGARVLWYWCVYAGEACQRTLAVSAAHTRVKAGGSLAVTVEAYNEQGVGIAAPGATVTLGHHSATAGAGGKATIVAPDRPGTYQLSARQSGLVTAFQRPIVVTASGG